MINMLKIACIIGIFSICACKHNNKLCTDYTGLLPAADSIGIETTINFYPDNSYTKQEVYIGEKDGTFIENGKFEIHNRQIMLTSNNNEKSFYRLEDKQIRMLDTSGKDINGNLADFYILRCR